MQDNIVQDAEHLLLVLINLLSLYFYATNVNRPQDKNKLNWVELDLKNEI